MTSTDTLADLRAGKLAGIRRLDLSCGLAQVPEEVFALADSLEVLNLSGNALADLPHGLSRLRRLKVLFCSDNRFTRVPEVLGDCAQLEVVGFKANVIADLPAAALPPRLRWLILTDNRLARLPAAVGERPRLQKLMLAGNRLDELPDSLAGAGRLELVRIAANAFEALPSLLTDLPRLAWLAYAGNPFHEADEAASRERWPARAIAWDALTMEHRLGEGASGVIHHARIGADGTPLAVKLFKGAMTSDGLPRSEMAACLAAGSHPNLVAVEGELQGHPEGRPGLVMRTIPPGFDNLAGPPSLESCTRDVYPEATRFDGPQALALARGIASAVGHLHARGVLHGDLYAHNILHAAGGEALLGDFGAASLLPADASRSRSLRRVESRAFGILLGELAARCDEASVRDRLAALQADCEGPAVARRPSFADITDRLA